MITQEEVQGRWKAIVGMVKEKFGQITGDDLTQVEGDLDKLIGLIQRKTGHSRERVEAFLDDAFSTAQSSFQQARDAAAEYSQQAGEAFRENYDHLAVEARRGYETTMKSVSRRPLESIAIALGAGVLTGLIVGLSMSSSNRRIGL